VETLAGALVPRRAVWGLALVLGPELLGLHGLQAERVPHGRGSGEAPRISGQEPVQAQQELSHRLITGRAGG
jgi:hypothetical protein